MIRRCTSDDFSEILTIINDGARAYEGVIPKDRWNDPYMSSEHLQHEIDSGVIFYGSDDSATGSLAGVMGIQQVHDVTLIRHAYVRTTSQKQGIGAVLLSHLRELTDRPILIGTWSDALWAIRFYERHGFPHRRSPGENSLTEEVLDRARPSDRNLSGPGRWPLAVWRGRRVIADAKSMIAHNLATGSKTHRATRENLTSALCAEPVKSAGADHWTQTK